MHQKIMMDVEVKAWTLVRPLVIARGTAVDQPVVIVTLRDGSGRQGRGEAAGVDYAGETTDTMCAALEEARAWLTGSITPEELLERMPPGGARNALDCALWDLRAKASGIPAFRSAGLTSWRPLLTAMTIGIGDDSEIRAQARAAAGHPLIKIKMNAARNVDALRIVREELPAARIIVDANGGWSRGLLERLMPQLLPFGVELVEQPLPAGEESELDGVEAAIPLAADESCFDRRSLPNLVGRFQAINIKLDKCGGLTEGLLLAQAAKHAGLELMVGNMCGSSLAMAPAFIIAQLCRFADLDGPLWQIEDIEPAMRYERGIVSPPDAALWG